MGEIIVRNVLSRLKLLMKLLLLRLFGCLYYCIGDARSHKYKKKIPNPIRCPCRVYWPPAPINLTTPLLVEMVCYWGGSTFRVYFFIDIDIHIYLTAIGLAPGGGITRHIYTTRQYPTYIDRKILIVRSVPRLCLALYPGIRLTTEGKAREKPQLG